MKKVRIGVLGGYRGNSMIGYCKNADNAEVVAICDKSPDVLERQRRNLDGRGITFYDNFDEFIQHDMDAVVLANYAHEHAPFAIRALKAGKHVYSEVLPAQTLKQAVELVEAVEESGLVYAYGENYCYMTTPYEMRRLYRQGKIGEFEYGEGEYVHNTEDINHSLTYGERTHWRNYSYSTFYCTHSLGPIVHITGLRPVRVIGIEGVHNERKVRCGRLGAALGMELVTLENGGIYKSLHGALYGHNVSFQVYGSKGMMESSRYTWREDPLNQLLLRYDEFSGAYNPKIEIYEPAQARDPRVKGYGHGGSDFFSMYNFVEKILGNPEADTIDVYEAMDMFLPGPFAYRSILNNSISMEIPDLRKRSERDKWRSDTACTDPTVAGDMLWPTMKSGTPDIPDEVYEAQRRKWEAEISGETGYAGAILGKKTK